MILRRDSSSGLPGFSAWLRLSPAGFRLSVDGLPKNLTVGPEYLRCIYTLGKAIFPFIGGSEILATTSSVMIEFT
jgi:hypothetical protein